MRLLDSELARAAAFADSRLDQQAWSPWNFETAHRSWSEYRSDIAIGLTSDEWYSVSKGFIAIEQIERHFARDPVPTTLNADDWDVLNIFSGTITEGANTLRSRLGLDEIGRF